MHPCEPFRSGAPHADFGTLQGVPCTPVEERCMRELTESRTRAAVQPSWE